MLELLSRPLFLLKFLVQRKYVGFIAELRQSSLRDRSEVLAHHAGKGVLRGSADDIVRFVFFRVLDSLNSIELFLFFSLSRGIWTLLSFWDGGVQGLLVSLFYFDFNDFIYNFL